VPAVNAAADDHVTVGTDGPNACVRATPIDERSGKEQVGDGEDVNAAAAADRDGEAACGGNSASKVSGRDRQLGAWTAIDPADHPRSDVIAVVVVEPHDMRPAGRNERLGYDPRRRLDHLDWLIAPSDDNSAASRSSCNPDAAVAAAFLRNSEDIVVVDKPLCPTIHRRACCQADRNWFHSAWLS
jgi:hypothetical protein